MQPGCSFWWWRAEWQYLPSRISVRNGKGDFGYNARKDEYENLKAAGVVDPAKVTRVALENAASIAGMFLTTECVITDIKEETPAPAMPNPGMGGMM